MLMRVSVKFTRNELKDYVRLVSKLYTLTSNFIKYYNDVVKQAERRNVNELPEGIRKLVLSGLNPEGEYVENAYSLFVKDFIGLSVEDPKLYVSKLKLRAEPNVKVVVEKPKFVEFVKLLNSTSRFIINKVRELDLSDVSIEEDITKQQSVEDVVAEIIKTSYDLSVGVNSFSTSVWGLRKTTPHYMKKAYENLSEDTLKLLGFSKLISVKEYELWGFPDYFTRCMLYSENGYWYLSINGVPALSKDLRKVLTTNPVEPETLGGAVCILNEIVWRYVNMLRETLSKWFKGIVDLEEEYVEEAQESLNGIGWSIPGYLKIGTYQSLYAKFEEMVRGIVGLSSYGSPFKFLVYDEDGVISRYVQWVYRGSYDRSGFYEYKLSQYIILPELFDDLMPAIFLGAIDATLYLNDKKAVLILVRTKRGD